MLFNSHYVTNILKKVVRANIVTRLMVVQKSCDLI